jgi:hypothetical protein
MRAQRVMVSYKNITARLSVEMRNVGEHVGYRNGVEGHIVFGEVEGHCAEKRGKLGVARFDTGCSLMFGGVGTNAGVERMLRSSEQQETESRHRRSRLAVGPPPCAPEAWPCTNHLAFFIQQIAVRGCSRHPTAHSHRRAIHTTNARPHPRPLLLHRHPLHASPPTRLRAPISAPPKPSPRPSIPCSTSLNE